MERHTWSGGGIDPARADFFYNDAGQRTEIKRLSNLAGTTQIDRTTFGYDAQGRQNDIVHRDSLDAVLADYDYVFDLADQLTSETHHGQTSTYTHDAAGQLTAADHSAQSDESYSFDLNGNRNSAGYVTSKNNQILTDGTHNYTYDGEGNLVTKTEIATGNVTFFIYDHRNRLVTVQERTPAGIITKETTYTYDVFDRQIAKSVDPDGVGSQTAQTTRFVYDGAHVWADYNAAGTVLARYLFGDRADEILARFQPGNGTAWYLTDHLGTVRDLANASGALLNHIDYDSFGRILSQTNATVGDRFTFTGREWDADVGLYYYRARFYDAQLGRFISQDPIGFAAGDPNLYRYVGNGVLMATDPSGTTVVASVARMAVVGGIAGAIGGLLCGVADWVTMQKSAGQGAADTVTFMVSGGLLGFVLGAGVGLVGAVAGPSFGTGFGLGFGAPFAYAYVMEDVDVHEDQKFWVRVGRAGCIGATVGAGLVVNRMVPPLGTSGSAGGFLRFDGRHGLKPPFLNYPLPRIVPHSGGNPFVGAPPNLRPIAPTSPGRILMLGDLQGTSPRVGDFTGLQGLKPSDVIARIPKNWIVEASDKNGGLVFRPPGEAGIRNHVRLMWDNQGPIVRILRNGGYVDNAGKTISGTPTPNKAGVGHIRLKWE